MYRLVCIAAIAITFIAGCGNPVTSAPEPMAQSNSVNADKNMSYAHVNATDNREVIGDLFFNYTVYIYWQKVGNTWQWRAEVRTTSLGTVIDYRDWRSYGPDQSGVRDRARDEFDGDHNGRPDGATITVDNAEG